MNYRDMDDRLLILLLEKCEDEMTRKYIESILLEHFSKFRDVSSLYRKIKKGNIRTESILWTAIALVLSTDKYIVDANLLDEIIENMPMNDLVILSNNSSNRELSIKARLICFRKQEEYVKEIGIYDRGSYFKEDICLLEKRRG